MSPDMAKSIQAKLINGMPLLDVEIEAWMEEQESLGNQATKNTAIPDKPKTKKPKVTKNKKEFNCEKNTMLVDMLDDPSYFA